MATVRCPSCHNENEAPPAGGPFFCSKCHSIIDPKGAIRADRARVRSEEPPPPPPPRASSEGAPPPANPSSGPLSRYGTTAARYVAGPGAGFAVGGSAALGYALAALVGIILAAGLGWAAMAAFRLPVVYGLLLGWAMKRALAAGCGGGTPDRGLPSSLLYLAIVVGAFAVMRYAEYLKVDAKESAHYRLVYNGFPPGDVKSAVIQMRSRDPDGDGRIKLDDGTTIQIDEEEDRLRAQFISRILPSDPYDIALLAAVGHKGFRGHLQTIVTKGETVRVFPDSKGWPLPGPAMILLWLAELVILGLAAFARVE